MTRFWLCLAMMATAQPAWAGDSDAPYYGPMKRWHGIGVKTGYEDRTEKDGSWRIDAAIHGRGDAIDLALYRAAERAHELGYRYVFLLGGRGAKSPGLDRATVFARPSHEAVPPTGCRSKAVATCYTADVMEIMRILGGADGAQPGVPVLNHLDELGREVFLSGYGTGAVATLVPGGVARSDMTTVIENRGKSRRDQAIAPVAIAAAPIQPLQRLPSPPPPSASYVGQSVYNPVSIAPPSTAELAAERFDRALQAAKPVRGREPKQGWTISD
ncbi:hypothetical protein [Sphingomonas sp. R86520]|uniref:hypothetical protein n=1 Tax=Sphingomonas sp. R86520 TaxID=3093859 RepID=UPI0036D21DDB